MSRAIIFIATLSLAFPVAGMAQSAAQTTSMASAPELHSMMKTAHSSEQYRQVAGYLRQRETDYRAKAEAQKVERDRRAQVNAGLTQKYPRPVDSAQYLYESYLYQAENAAGQARRYDQLAGTPEDSRQIATASGQ
ncbi:MAG TPA: hypothetical protein VGN01_10725 [Acidobacteriaceae bacterium]|jgi:hypothetical protein